jgi:hypothetical protein
VPRRLDLLTVTQQAVGIATDWPDQPRPTVRRNTLRWNGTLQPSAVSPAYRVSLVYRLTGPPLVHVLDPPLDPGHRDALPHVYEDDRLCLVTPGEWNGTMQIAKTVLPWAAEWLFHYEAWRTTDRWVGGGRPYLPSTKTRAPKGDREKRVGGG